MHRLRAFEPGLLLVVCPQKNLKFLASLCPTYVHSEGLDGTFFARWSRASTDLAHGGCLVTWDDMP